jgi:protein O-GlcNAc transferase
MRLRRTGVKGGMSQDRSPSLRLDTLFGEAVKRYQAGQIEEAHRICRQILATDPSHLNALHLTGFAALQAGQSQFAAEMLGRVASLAPNSAAAHNGLGTALAQLGEFDGAIAAYRRGLALQPNDLEAHNNLGNIYRERNQFAQAIACYRQALSLRPGYTPAHHGLGTAFRDQGKLDDAVASFRRALELAPNDVDALNDLGITLGAQGRFAEAIASYRRALAIDPAHPDTYNNLGVALVETGELTEAIALYRQALAIQPYLRVVHVNLGIALRQRGLLSEAITALEDALACPPGQATDDAKAEAELLYAKALACDWTEIEALSERLLEAVRRGAKGVSPFILLSQPSSPAEQLLCARQWVEAFAQPPADKPHRYPRRRSGKIRLGYLSADFRADPVSTLIPELIERHDRSRFEVAAYCYGVDDGSDMRRRLRGAFDRFSDLGSASIADAVAAIRSDGVDLLIDLLGHTAKARSGILAFRPAPIQVSYLGFAGTMGADFIDYAIVDRHIVPIDQQPFYAEQLVHLPECYQPSDTKRPLAELGPSRRECGLPERDFVFCSFNNTYKITRTFFDVWTRLLRQVPGSVLWLIETNAIVMGNLRREAAAHGISPDRLIFSGRVPTADYLARLGIADLFLDTLPYNAGATANDALWVGLPLVTCTGSTYVGRMAGSLLRAVNLPELVTDSLAEYEALALRLATEPGLLSGLRQKLLHNRATAPLFDIGRYAMHLEAAYARMWDTWRRGEAPTGFASPPANPVA